jgi:hypothetical protein
MAASSSGSHPSNIFNELTNIWRALSQEKYNYTFLIDMGRGAEVARVFREAAKSISEITATK